MDKSGRSSLLLLLICLLIIHGIHAANDTVDTSQSLRDGETLVSSGGMFELGFFSLGNSTNRYLGIWYKNISVRTYVWVANRETPLTTKSGVLRVTQPGNLSLFNDTNGIIIWSTNGSTSSIGNPATQLLDSGNLVVKDVGAENFIWQSFEHPSDTDLPGTMGLGWNLVTGVETYMSSWRSDDDPAPGEYTTHMDPSGYPQMLIKKGQVTVYNSGPWNGLGFSGTPALKAVVITQTLRMNKREIKYGSNVVQRSIVSRAILSPDGVILRTTWNQRTESWNVYRNMPSDSCDNYNACGANGNCSFGKSPPCGCLDRFVPKDPRSLTGADWSNGCVRRTALSCHGDVFLRYPGIKLPDAQNSTYDEQIIRLEDCEAECSRNCTCTAYTQLNIRGSGSGCLFYHGDFINIRTLPGAGQDLYIRMASADRDREHSKGKRRVILIASFTSVAGIGLLCLGLVLYSTRKRNNEINEWGNGAFVGSHGEEADLQFFHLSIILKATDHFANSNKLGEGGFGPVYKGKLEGGQEIAVKRMSKTSTQGIDELKNEVILIAKLQHRNLVRLLGCCIQKEENMLIYEYMPNNSLDVILFDQTKSMLLDWQKRFHIINGVAKGLLYLHQDSRLRIIHRDLKASNVLLDADMNPKISDFGLARSFGENETAAKTRRVIGTYGYMSPEYLMNGLFSIKSDVFSFGVLVLEVVSGKRNKGDSQNDHELNLIGNAWTLYREGNSGKLVDATLGDSLDLSQVLRSIHVGLLCVQGCPKDRPNMSSVVFMLGNEQVELPQIKQPGFFTEIDVFAAQFSSSTDAEISDNQLTHTMPQGR